MPQRLVHVLIALVLLPPAAAAQRAGLTLEVERGSASWAPPAPATHTMVHPTTLPRPPEGRSRDRLGNALLGGAIEAVAGVAFCTVVSKIANDPGTGSSTCTAKGYLLTGGGLRIGTPRRLIV